MLTDLHLRDFVIVEEAHLEIDAGMTALTGETGAGKSIVVDALAMIAGGRASGDVVREGAERAEVAATFAALPAAALAWLEEQSIAHDGEVIARRVVGADGRSRAYLNGQPVPLQSMRQLVDRLIDVHGQQEFQQLVARDAQRSLLDEHAAAGAVAARVAALHAGLREAQRDLEARRAAAANADARRELLRFEIGELRDALAGIADLPALFADRKRIADRGRLAEAARAALALSYDGEDGSANDLVARAQAALRPATAVDPDLHAVARLLDSVAIELREAADTLRRYLEALDVDPARIEEIERRAAALEGLARKHRVRPEELPARAAELARELDGVESAVTGLAQLEERCALLGTQYRTAAGELSAARRAGATDLATRISALMQSLGMPGGRFEIAVATDPESCAAHGQDVVDFLVAANPGQSARPIAKVASGGELSRIGLAIQVAAAARTRTACLVFDEVDTGVGGATAEIVGRQLRSLALTGQVLCVTHLPQVASQAHAQWRVEKQTNGRTTRARIERLDDAGRVEEIARMLGGVDVSAQARAHAREMLERGAAAANARPAKRSRPAR